MAKKCSSVASLVVVYGAICSGAREVVAESSMCSVATEALTDASRLRHLEPTRKVPCVVRTTAEVERFLRDTLSAKFPKNLLSMEERVYQALGVIPDEYPYADRIVRAYVSQIGGYYDPERKTFVMVDTMAKSLRYSVAVHELTHALQDQHFGLLDFLDPKHKSDELMAHAALVEGDATAIMQDSGRERRSAHTESATSPVQSAQAVEVPEALERVLLFPYVEGLSFVRALQKEGGVEAINRSFRHPPRSSREVLHPAEYLHGSTALVVPTVASLVMGDSTRTFEHTDSLGEFTILAMLEAGGLGQSAARRAAQGLRGDLVGVSIQADGTFEVVWRTVWDSHEDAKSFAQAYKAFLESRYGKEIREENTEMTHRKSMSLRVLPEDATVVVSVVMRAAS